ncbi:hypothetical protein GDI3423 [Gluconacetobacter diazotrophicus PA1 5]|uniref:Uncharacterized protein n=1 Tax=Gluconacetobacter diazotrophicus (strain ATCC 49037 / DSM 5601 / CCUG 37298 / CIP 103539 / LMG 7603 / PAl5) TaxID=272568 RepID=A9H3V8_GLUDA|nr:hypothetical protein GDI3423 [Gluconacetobacter diazotrophicus PA1 5]
MPCCGPRDSARTLPCHGMYPARRWRCRRCRPSRRRWRVSPCRSGWTARCAWSPTGWACWRAPIPSPCGCRPGRGASPPGAGAWWCWPARRRTSRPGSVPRPMAGTCRARSMCGWTGFRPACCPRITRMRPRITWVPAARCCGPAARWTSTAWRGRAGSA